jgi:hypothetical protein
MLPRGLVAREDVGGVVAVVTLLVCATLLGCKGRHDTPQQTSAPGSASAASKSAHNPSGLAQAKDLLARSNTLELLLLDAGRAELSNEGGPERLVIRLSDSNVVSVPILRRVRVTKQQEIESLRSALGAELVPEITAGWCFEPRYAIRGDAGEQFTLALSYRCARAQVEGPGAPFTLGLVPNGGSALDRLLGA